MMKAENKPGIRIPVLFRLTTLFVFFFFVTFPTPAQDSLSVNKKRLKKFVVISTVGYGSALIGLNQLWYQNSARQSFRFFNDNPEWKQVDKIGHFYSSYYFSSGTSRALRRCNVDAKKSDWIGAVAGFLVLVPVEIFDGFSVAYGASGGDLMADAAGSAFFVGQQLLWKQQRLIPKFSFSRSAYARLRPEVLGDNLISEIFKDYNGQTYWLSVDVDKFITFPKWLNIVFGYGAHEMFYARDAQNKSMGYHPYRQYYIGLDPDLTAIRTRSKVIKALIFIGSAIKIPAPALEFSRKGPVFHGLF